MQQYKRATRVGELIQQEISKIVLDLKQPGVGFVTITGVKLTDDLQQARVFYSILGGEEEVARTKTVLHDAIPMIRHELAVRLNLRRTPSIFFVYDETPERASRIFSILEKIKSDETTPGPELKKPEEPEKPAPKKKPPKSKNT